ncbi:MAG TPA: hypothetical protein DCG13_02430, partial [Legionellales bacterium]|nr:hypothetical protein [Legionellales bacterium]
MNPTELSHALAQRSPPKRLQFIRQIILKQNQARFCEDGIIRMGTLKSIESARMDIGVKMAERLVHKLSLEGILCDKDLFLAPNSLCVIRFDDTQKALTQKARQSLEIIRQKVTQLVPITITTA